MESMFQKYLLNEQHFGATAKKDVVNTIDGYLSSFKKNAMNHIRERLEVSHRVNDYKEVGDAIETELGRLNAEYITKLTEFINTRKF